MPLDYWRARQFNRDYLPADFPADGFIHCTDGDQNLLDTANRYYRDDERAFGALVIDQSCVEAEIRYEDPARIYPHVYGALNRDAIVGIVKMRRDATGAFVAIEG